MSRWIKDWNPEDAGFWEKSGKSIARRNLIWSILAENLGFSVWLVWSIAATKLPSVGFKYTTAQLFTLGMLAFQAALCDRPASAARLLQHNLGRIARRRARRYFPRLVPEEWSA